MGGARDIAPDFDLLTLRRALCDRYIANNGYDLALARQQLGSGAAAMVAFGHPVIANPDLVERLRTGAPLAALDRYTLYGGGARGYTDYP